MLLKTTEMRHDISPIWSQCSCLPLSMDSLFPLQPEIHFASTKVAAFCSPMVSLLSSAFSILSYFYDGLRDGCLLFYPQYNMNWWCDFVARTGLLACVFATFFNTKDRESVLIQPQFARTDSLKSLALWIWSKNCFCCWICQPKHKTKLDCEPDKSIYT